jgi:hypothetical protein
MAVNVIEKRIKEKISHPSWPKLTNIAEKLGFIEGGEDDVKEDHSSDDSYDDKQERNAKKEARKERMKTPGPSSKRNSPFKSSKKKSATSSVIESDGSDSDVFQTPRLKQRVKLTYSSSDTEYVGTGKAGVYTPSPSKKRPSRLSVGLGQEDSRQNVSCRAGSPWSLGRRTCISRPRS